DIGTTVLGRQVKTPIILGPSGAHRIVSKPGETAVAAAASRHGGTYVLSVGASRSIEEVAAAGPGANLWFQLYLWQDREWSRRLMDRARAADFGALCVTVDIKAPGGRKYRDIRNGVDRMPESLGPQIAIDGLRHPRWLSGYLSGGPIRM